MMLWIRTALMMAAACCAHADWNQLQRITSGTGVTVQLRGGELLKGRLQSVTTESLRLVTRDGKPLDASKDAIARVTRKSRSKGALWGAIIGFGCAVPFGAYAGPYFADYGNPSSGVRLRHAGGWGMFGAGIGAGIGALTGMSTTIYRN